MNSGTALMILKLLDLITVGLQLAPALKASYDKHRAALEAMINENRDPTAQEFEELVNEINANTEALNS